MALTAEEQALLEALESEGVDKIAPTPVAQKPVAEAAPSRSPSDSELVPSSALTAEEEAILGVLENEIEPPRGSKNDQEGYVAKIGNFIDQYTGAASTRKAVGTLMDGGGIGDAANAAYDQYFQHPDNAPTGKEIAVKAGFSDNGQTIPRNPMAIQDEQRAFNRQNVPTTSQVASPASVVGLGVDLVADPLNALPFVPIAKIAGAAGKTFNMALKGSAAAAKVADNVVTGGKIVEAAGKASDVANYTSRATIEASKNATRSLKQLFSPNVAPDFEKLKAVAESNGIDPSLLNEAHEFGESSVVSRAARHKAEGPLGNGALEKHNDLVYKISNATDQNIASFGGSNSIPGKQEAGRILREGYDKGVENFFNQMDVTYNSVLDMAPGIQLTPVSKKIIDSKMAGLEKQAKGLLKRGISDTDRSQAKEILRGIAAYRNSGPSLKQQKEAMNMIGRTAFKAVKSGAELPSDIRTLREMYFTLQRGFTESTKAYLGDDIAEALTKNNKAMSEHFTERGPLEGILSKAGVSDEAAFDSLVGRLDSKKIGALKNILPAEEFNKLKSAAVNDMVVRNADNVVNFKATRKRINASKEQLQNLLSPEEMGQLDDILLLGDRSGIGVLSTSGTGGSSLFKDITGTVKGAVMNDVMIDNLKQSARSKLKPTGSQRLSPGSTAIDATEVLPPSPRSKSGIQLLKENKRTTGQALKLKATDERNKRLELIKQYRRK